MSGVEWLLDTNLIIGVMGHYPPALASLRQAGVTVANAGYSSITRIEVLGFPGITAEEAANGEALLADLAYYPLDRSVESRAIRLRQAHRIKIPDAIILATALVHGLALLTLDKDLAALSDRAA